MTSPPHLGATYRPDLDGLRAVAVLGVVAFHADVRLAPGGFAGVDIFFVISGYLISRLVIDGLVRGTFGFRTFFARRLVRLAPALAFVLIACWAAGWLLLLPPEYEQLGRHIAAGAGFIANLVFWQESGHYFDVEAAAKPLLHLWSLGVEEQFYLIWPLCLAVAWSWRIPLLALVVGLGAVSFGINVATVGAYPAAAFYLPPARLWELAAGGVLAGYSFAGSDDPRLGWPTWASRAADLAPRGLSSAAGIAGAVLLAMSLGLLGGRSIPGWWALLPVAGAVLIIAAGPHAWINRTVLSHPVMTFVGVISYPLYLWHWPVLTFTRIVSSQRPDPWLIAAAVLVSVLLAWLTYRFIEQPVRAAYREGGRFWLPLRLAGALAIAAAAGVAVLAWSRELPPRFPASVQYLVDFKFDYATAYRERRCYLMPDQARDAFADECVDAPGLGRSPLIVLWGDSHAAHLYPGLRRLQAEVPFRLAQFTTSACPPLRALDVPEQPFCRDKNESVLARIRHLRPDVVLLAARWDAYRNSHLDQTVAALRRVTQARIVVLGSLPNWTDRIPRLLFNAARRHPLAGIPSRLPFFRGRDDQADRGLRERAERLGVVFVSAYRILCNRDGCLVKMGSGPRGLTTWDDHHLTSEGSAFVVRRLAPRLFERARRGSATTGPRRPVAPRRPIGAY